MARKSRYGDPSKDVHICVGIYPDRTYQVNYVRDGDLDENVEYNRSMRPGRYYFVDGEYACGGILKAEEKEAKLAELKLFLESLAVPESDTDSRPYQ